MIAACVGIFAGARIGVFGGQDDFLPVITNKFANKLFARPIGIYVRGVNKIPACRAVRLVDLASFVFSRTPASIFAECHGAE
jgi:hypothetical protein